MEWPSKKSCEALEISEFIDAYARLPGSPRHAIVGRGERPDLVVVELASGMEFGVELTSVYLDDRSVPDVHMSRRQPSARTVPIPYETTEVERYEERLLTAIQDKIAKARAGYDRTQSLILAIYVDEYIGIHFGRAELEDLVRRHEDVFDTMAPFVELVFYSLGNGGVFQVRPS